MRGGAAVFLAATLFSGTAFAGDMPSPCAVHSASRQETIRLFDPIDGLRPSEIASVDTEARAPRFRDGLLASSRQMRETWITDLTIIGADWTVADGLHAGMTRAAFLDRHGAALRDDDRTSDVVAFEWRVDEGDFGADGCRVTVTFDDADRIAALAMQRHELRVHPDPPPDDD